MNKIKQFYSINFDKIKRKKANVKFLIFHYTGMRSEKSAINKLSDKKIKSQLSLLYKKKWIYNKFSTRPIYIMACRNFILEKI